MAAPHDEEAEKAVIGAVLLSSIALEEAMSTGLSSGDFYRPSFGHIFEAARRVAMDCSPDVVLVRSELVKAGIDYVTVDQLHELAALAPGVSNARHYATVIRAHAHRRHVMADALDLAEAARNGDEERMDRLRAALTTPLITTTDTVGSIVDWATAFDRTDAGDFLLEPIIARGRGHALYASQKVGKSLLMASVLVPAALGWPVLDRPAGPPLRTLYLDYEMTLDDVAERLEAMGVGPEHATYLEPLAYHVLPSIPPLDTAEGGQAVLDMALAHRADLVVIDTLGRAVQGEENDADTFRDYYRHTGSRLKAAGIASWRSDHAGKDADRGQRGSSAKADDVDVVWRLTARDADRFTLTATHRRMGWIPATVELHRTDDPLAFERVEDSWPDGTAATAHHLDGLGAPLDVSVRTARALLQGSNQGARTDVVAAACRFRRTIGYRSESTP